MYQPSALPINTSAAKCLPPVTREALMPAAVPYASNWVKKPGYSWEITLATDHAAAACSEGKELPPCQNSPFPLPCSGRFRPAASWRIELSRKVFMSASPLNQPVSRARSLFLRCPQKYRVPAAPTREAVPKFEKFRLRRIESGLPGSLLSIAASFPIKNEVLATRGMSQRTSVAAGRAGRVQKAF